MISDEKNIFIERINRHDVEAYRSLYKNFYPALVAYSCAMVSDQQVAEDIVQDLFIKLWEGNLKFMNIVPFKVYLYNSVRNASLNHLRSIKVEEKYFDRVRDMYGELKTSYDLEKEELYESMYREIDCMPERMREVFLMHLSGLSNQEIADKLDLAVETVKTQKKRAKARLKDKFGICALLLLFSKNLYPLICDGVLYI